MYKKLIQIAQKYVGVSAPIFIDAVLADANLSKTNLSYKDLEILATSAVKKLNSYGLDSVFYAEPVRKAILSLQDNDLRTDKK